MNSQRHFFHPLSLGVIGSLLGTAVSPGILLVNLDPAIALYDSDVKGIVNDAGNGPGDTTGGHASGIPLLDTAEHVNGFTFNIAFTPLAADLTGTRLLIEIGATSNGSGLYLVDGVPTFVGKQGSNDATLPTSLNDTTLNTIAVQSSFGKLQAGTSYSYSVSWNQAGTLELIVAPDGGAPLLNSFAISGTPGNWSGNDTLSVKTVSKANLGGLSGNNAANIFGAPFDVDNTSNFTGAVSRAIFWKENAVTPLTLTAPVVQGFKVTSLPTGNKVRLHWSVTEGGLPNPTTLVIKDTDTGNTVHTPAGLSGFVDLPAGVTNYALTATNATGAVTAPSGVEADNSFSATIRSDAPAAWYRFNEAAGSKLLVDSAENAAPHNGQLIGNPVAGSGGFVDGAGAFEGGSTIKNGLIFDPSVLSSTLGHSGFSIEAVVRRRPGAAGNHVLVSQTDVSGVGRAILGISENGEIFSQIGVGTLTLPGATTTVAAERKSAVDRLEANRWAHLVLVVDGGTPASPGNAEIRFYLDGKLIGSSRDGTSTSYVKDFLLESSLGDWIIGSAKSLAGDFWKGDIDEIAIYPKLLDDPDGNGDETDSTIPGHRNSWYARTSGILSFVGSSSVASTGDAVTLTVRTGADVSSVSIDNGIGNVPIVDGLGTVTVVPTATTTYRVTATGAGGATTTQDVLVTYQQLTAPVILGLEQTTLPTSGKVRLHWRVSAGNFPTPTTVVIDAGGTSIPNPALQGFADLTPAEAANVTLTATNLIGTVSKTATAVPAADTPFSAAVRTDNPVAWFRFNEASGSNLIVDSAENAKPHNGTPTAASVSRGESAFVDGVGSFDGARGVITDRIVNLDEVQKGFTIEAIVRNEPGTTGTNRAIVSQQDLNGTGRLIISVDDNGVIRSVLGGGIRKDADTKVLGKTWSHVVIVANILTSELRWYVDGEYAGTSKDGQNPDGTLFDPTQLFESSEGAWTIGVHKGLDANFWKGQIDEIAIYDSVLDEIDPPVDAPPGTEATISNARILAHRNAWYSETSGLLYSAVSAKAIDPGGSVDLSLKVGADVTSAQIDNGVGSVTLVNGSATVTLHPTITTTYTITLNTPTGPVVQTVTITVNGTTAPAGLQLLSSSLANGNFTLNFSGTPSTTYSVRGSTDLATFPIDHGSATTDANGAGSVIIAIDPLKSKEFFRIESAQ